MGITDQRYDDTESARIIRRALEIQEKGRVGHLSSQGLSLPELEAVGRETGIDPEFVRRAALELASESEPMGRFARFFFGNRVRASLFSLLKQRPSRESLQALLGTLPVIIGDTGTGSLVGDALVWNSDARTIRRSGMAHSVSIGPTASGADVRIRTNLGNIAAGLFGGIVGGVGVGAGLAVGISVGLVVLHSPLFMALVPVGFFISAWLLARRIFSSISRKRRERNGKILESISGFLEGRQDPLKDGK